MKLNKASFIGFVLVLMAALMQPSCGSNKTGCPINEEATAGFDKKGNLINKKGKTSLFPKDFNKPSKKKPSKKPKKD